MPRSGSFRSCDATYAKASSSSLLRVRSAFRSARRSARVMTSSSTSRRRRSAASISMSDQGRGLSAHRLDEHLERGPGTQAPALRAGCQRFVPGVASPRDGLQGLGSKPDHQPASLARQRDREHAAGDVLQPCGDRAGTGQRVGDEDRSRRGFQFGLPVQPGGQCVELRHVRHAAHAPPAVQVVQRDATGVDGIEQRRLVCGQRHQVALAGRTRYQLLVHVFQLEPVGQLFGMLGGLQLQ